MDCASTPDAAQDTKGWGPYHAPRLPRLRFRNRVKIVERSQRNIAFLVARKMTTNAVLLKDRRNLFFKINDEIIGGDADRQRRYQNRQDADPECIVVSDHVQSFGFRGNRSIA